jgi:transcriptional regulator with XRE-family HTH domain
MTRTVIQVSAMPTLRSRLSPVGELLRRWRALRHLSQLDLGLRVDVSARHISFVETGRAEPSREMILRLADGLDLPLAERNALLTAAGYAPLHPARSLASAQMTRVRAVLGRLLGNHEPYPALALDARWDLVEANAAALRLFTWLEAPLAAAPDRPPNLLWAMFDPAGLRPYVADWPDAARFTLRRVHRELTARGGDDATQALLMRILQLPGVPQDWQYAGRVEEELPFLTFTLVKDDLRLAWLSTITTFGSPQDVTLQGLQIESFFPADDPTETRWRQRCRE